MKTIAIALLCFFVVTFFYSCALYRTPVESIKPHNNADYQVDYLFEHDGCKVYRFIDNGNYVYFTNCNGNVTSIENDSTETRVTTITRSTRSALTHP